MISWNVNSAIVPNETSVHFHAAIVIEGTSDRVIPEVNISGSSFYALMGFFHGGHDHCSEMLQGQDYYLVVVVLPLIVVCSSRKKVCLLVGSAGFMMEGEMVFC